jgi:hypothetical protein
MTIPAYDIHTIMLHHICPVTDPKIELRPVLQEAIDLTLSLFDGHRATYRGLSGSGFAVVKPDFPSPPDTIGELNDGVFYSLVLHRISPHGGAGN